MNGEKINAIKALRECAGKGGTDQTMVGLSHAKCIVESIMDNVITENGESRIINITAS
jgi:ribosomal protein L7/L12